MACVNLPALPLQILIQRCPEWMDQPAAVVDKDKPQGTILWVNKRAARCRILPGMRYAKGLSLSSDLRAGVVSSSDIDECIEALTETLRFFTPDVEASHEEPGLFWLGASGLSLLYPSLKQWAGLIGESLSRLGFFWSVAVGFSRYGTYAVAKASKGIRVLQDPADERARARAVPLVRLGVDPELRDALDQLAIATVGGFIDLPEHGIRKRFGNDAYQLYKLARDELYAPIDSRPPEDPFDACTVLDHPETHVERLMHMIEPLLASILERLAAKSSFLAALTLSLALDNGDKRSERLQPARPTLDVAQICRLIELRLQRTSLTSGVTDIHMEAAPVRVPQKQLELFAKKPQRDLELVDRAFATLRAEFGEGAVMRARLKDGHLPEACYEWEPLEKLTVPTPRKVTARHLVRRIFERSVEFLSWTRNEEDDRRGGVPPVRLATPALPGSGNGGKDMIGPYIVSGGWWLRRVHREYYYVRSAQGRWLWVYYDKRRRRAFVQGVVE